jgi:beta-galactosidase
MLKRPERVSQRSPSTSWYYAAGASHEQRFDEPITRRNLLGTAFGATMLGGAFLSTEDQVVAQTPRVGPCLRESMDFGWRFFKGDVSGAQAPGSADAQWRAVDVPHD